MIEQSVERLLTDLNPLSHVAFKSLIAVPTFYEQSLGRLRYPVVLMPVSGMVSLHELVAFSSLARIWGECLTIHSPPACFFF